MWLGIIRCSVVWFSAVFPPLASLPFLSFPLFLFGLKMTNNTKGELSSEYTSWSAVSSSVQLFPPPNFFLSFLQRFLPLFLFLFPSTHHPPSLPLLSLSSLPVSILFLYHLSFLPSVSYFFLSSIILFLSFTSLPHLPFLPLH